MDGRTAGRKRKSRRYSAESRRVKCEESSLVDTAVKETQVDPFRAAFPLWVRNRIQVDVYSGTKKVLQGLS